MKLFALKNYKNQPLAPILIKINSVHNFPLLCLKSILISSFSSFTTLFLGWQPLLNWVIHLYRSLMFLFLLFVSLMTFVTPKLEDHPLSSVRGCLFNIFAAILHSWRPFLHLQPEDAPCCSDREPTMHLEKSGIVFTWFLAIGVKTSPNF
jgi:hypothetical protein